MLSITFRTNRVRVVGEDISIDVTWGEQGIIPKEVLTEVARVIHEGFSDAVAELFFGLCEQGAPFYLEVGEGAGNAR